MEVTNISTTISTEAEESANADLISSKEASGFVVFETIEECAINEDKLGKLIQECEIPPHTVEECSTEVANVEDSIKNSENHAASEEEDLVIEYISVEPKTELTIDENTSMFDEYNSEESMDSSENFYNPFIAAESVSDSPVNSLLSRIGPFADNRPICECDTMKLLTSRAETRFLLSLLPDMAEMNHKQKFVFRNRVKQLIGRVIREFQMI